ncbi:YqhA family protein [Candidatus Woesearchaeota archaeon]|nr:YqhA family protein [Candidatus Woesearchaeota archaeon]
MIKKLIEESKILVYFAIIGSLIASLLLFLVTTFKLVKEIFSLLIYSSSDLTAFSVSIISALDSYLLAVIVYIFSLSLYGLFIGGLKVPTWLEVHNLDDLKKKLSSVIALILAVLFLKHVVAWENGKETLYFAISISLMMAALIAYIIVKDNINSKH